MYFCSRISMAFTIDEEFEMLEQQLEKGIFLSTKFNNDLLLSFIKSKMNGGYGRIVYDKVIGKRTAIKKSRNIKKVDDFFKKDFKKITETELLHYRDLLNDNKIMKNKTKIIWENKKPRYEVVKTKTPLKYRTKDDYKSNFCELYRFYIETIYQKEKKDIKDITKFFKIRRPVDFEEVEVKFIPNDEIEILLQNIKNKKFKI